MTIRHSSREHLAGGLAFFGIPPTSVVWYFSFNLVLRSSNLFGYHPLLVGGTSVSAFFGGAI